MSGGLAEHLVALPGEEWALWRSLVVRGAGFPARGVLELATPAAAAAADHVLRLEREETDRRQQALESIHQALDDLRREGHWDDKQRRRPLLKAIHAVNGGKLPPSVPEPACAAAFAELAAAAAELAAARHELAQVYGREVARVSAGISRVAGEDRFREAVIWQNRQAVKDTLDWLAAGPRTGSQPAVAPPAGRSSRQRATEVLAVSYLQRYCTKNDTIGFFGPVAFAELCDDGDPLSIRYGARLLQRRSVYFEVWCIDALARALGADPAIRPWLAPRLRPSVRRDGDTLHRSYGKPLSLRPEEVSCLALCDGRRPAREIAARLLAEPAMAGSAEADVYRLLETLCQKRLLTWTLDVPLELHPEQTLAAQLERVQDVDLRVAALNALAELEQARDRVAAAAGDSAALSAALGELENTFTRLTGLPATRRPGQIYAARGLVYEECRRDVAVRFGPELTARLGPPLALVLRAARWVAGELAKGFEASLRVTYEQLRSRNGAGGVPCAAFYSAALSSMALHGESLGCARAVASEFQRRWELALGGPPALDAREVRFAVADVAAGFAAAFGDPAPVWTLGRYLSPDLMIGAPGEEGLRRGEFELVLGEIHSGITMLSSCFVSEHPAIEVLLRMLEQLSAASTVVLPQRVKQTTTQRFNLGLRLPDWYQFLWADEPASHRVERLLPAGDMVIEDGACGLRARTRDGSVDLPVVDLFEPHLTIECSSLIGSWLAPARHLPRVRLDGLVIHRERWSFAAAELDFLDTGEAVDRFLALRRWASAAAMPRFCFYRASTEKKPCFLDLESPVSGEVFARFVRSARRSSPEATIAVSEMLPRLGQAWLGDAAGNLYTSELRLMAAELSRNGRTGAGC